MANGYQTRAARRAPPTIGRAGARVFADLARKTRYAEPNLADNWATIAGEEIAALCRPGRILGERSGRTLEIAVASGAAAAEMQMRADELLARINRYLGPGGVARISIKQTQGGPREPERGDDDSPLGKALASFRAAVSRRNITD